jgi:hypothetical protein
MDFELLNDAHRLMCATQMDETGFVTRNRVDAAVQVIKKDGRHSLFGLCQSALAEFAPEHMQNLGVAVASILGEISNDVEFHNNRHYRNVCVRLIDLIRAYHFSPEPVFGSLSSEQIVCLFIAVCIHDLGHDGQTNCDKPGFIEARSYNLSESVLISANVDQASLKSIRTMMLCTDVIGKIYIQALRDAVHLHRRNGDLASVNLPLEVSMLASSREVTLMALLLHEADIATSEGIDYETTIQESLLLAQEAGRPAPRPSDVLKFLQEVCDGSWRSTASQHLYAGARQAIAARIQADRDQGDHPYQMADL